MLQHGAGLREGNAGKELSKLSYWHAVFKVLEQRCYRYTRTSKYPDSADALGVALHCIASRPVNHDGNSSTRVEL